MANVLNKQYAEKELTVSVCVCVRVCVCVDAVTLCAQVWVEIVDVNDNAPRFPEDRIVHQLSEATEVGSTFVVPSAFDPDSRRNGVARYELRPADGLFRLSVRHNALAESDSDLRVVLVDKLDREVNDRYQVMLSEMQPKQTRTFGAAKNENVFSFIITFTHRLTTELFYR